MFIVLLKQWANVNTLCSFSLSATFYSLFWSMFGQVSINDISVKHPKPDGGKI